MATNGEFCGERQEHSIQKCDAGSKVARPQSNFLDIGTTLHLPATTRPIRREFILSFIFK